MNNNQVNYNMLQIIVNNTKIELQENTKIRILLKSPIYYKKEGSYSFPVDVYLSVNNIKAFGINMQNPYSSLFKDYDATIRLKSRELRCKLSIASIKGKILSFYLKIDRANFISESKGKTLQGLSVLADSDSENVSWLSVEEIRDYMMSKANSSFPESSMAPPITFSAA